MTLSPSNDHLLRLLKGALIVSCQAPVGSPMRTQGTIVALAQCAQLGGAGGVRVDSATNVAAVQAAISLPIIGIDKVVAGDTTLITPDLGAIPVLAAAGASVVAIELTRRAYPDASAYANALAEVENHWAGRGRLLMADISTYEEGVAALACGVDFVGTTLAGYTSYSQPARFPNLDLVERLVDAGARVIAEGGYGGPEEASEAIRRGAWSVCAGAAITDPIAITRKFASALSQAPTADGLGTLGSPGDPP